MAPESPREREPQGLQGSSLSIRAMKNFPEGKASELAGGRVPVGFYPSAAQTLSSCLRKDSMSSGLQGPT